MMAGMPPHKQLVNDKFMSLKWAERDDQTAVTDAAFTSVVTHFVGESQRGHLNNALYGDPLMIV